MRQGKATGEMKNQPTEEGKLTDFRDSSLWAPISRNLGNSQAQASSPASGPGHHKSGIAQFR